MRLGAGHCLGPLVAAGAAWLGAACTVVVPLEGVGTGDVGARSGADGPGPGSAPSSSTPDAGSPADSVAPEGDDGGGKQCFDQPVPLQMVPPQAIIAFDRSSTMTDMR